MILITDCQYFSPSIFYKKAINYTHIKYDIYEAYRKMSFRNRCVVAGSNGPVILSIPLAEGRNQKRPVKDVRIDQKTDWQGQHWKTIMSCYNRSPWFEYYREELKLLYSQSFQWLADWNMTTAEWMFRKLDFTGRLETTTQFQPVYDEPDFEDWRNKLLPKTIVQQFPQPVFYRQVFEDKLGFLPHLSILDLLFCEGKKAVELLKT